MLLVLLVAAIFLMIVFGRAGVNLVKSCLMLLFGSILLLAGCAIL